MVLLRLTDDNRFRKFPKARLGRSARVPSSLCVAEPERMSAPTPETDQPYPCRDQRAQARARKDCRRSWLECP